MQVSTRLFDFNIITDSKKLTHLNCIESESCESQDNSDDNEYKDTKRHEYICSSIIWHR